MKKAYVDTETTGTDPKRHGVIQISAVFYVNGVAKASFDKDVMPFPQDEIEDESLEKNRISREELFQTRDLLTGRERLYPEDAYKAFTFFLGNFINRFNPKDKALWIGYRAGFDSDFMREWFKKAGDTYFGAYFWTPPLCVMTLAAYILQKERANLENFKLRTVYEYLHPENAGRFTDEDWHDALFDIDRTIDIESKLRDRLRPKATQVPSGSLVA